MRSRRCLADIVLVAGFGAGAALPLASAEPTANLGGNGIGAVRFGLTKAEAVQELSSLFGTPTWRGVDKAAGRIGPRSSGILRLSSEAARSPDTGTRPPSRVSLGSRASRSRPASTPCNSEGDHA
jgi:hypothetical protein